MEFPKSLLRSIAYYLNLHPSHNSRPLIKQDILKYQSGFLGERSIQYFLYPIIYKNFLPFHNARLTTHGQNFEIDLTLITSQFLLIIEVKNHRGDILLDHESGGMLQTISNSTKLYQDPIIQVERQRDLLDAWLRERGFQIPIETVVVFTNRNVTINRQADTDSRIIYGYKLAPIFKQLQQQYQSHPHVIQKERFNRLLVEESNPLDIKFMNKYDIVEEDFVLGATCSRCLKKTMMRNRHIWKCAECGYEDSDAMVKALKERYMIYGPKITNEQARQWLKETDRHYIRKLLMRLAEDQIGTGKGAKYIMNFDERKDYEFLIDWFQRLK
ncbi:nuclease-related domain-containing protein [Aquisalibacillus elongatus]|uniref:Nuclease-like protein n=1 Tax=Aquisalibacillus elongatus TaxID=485577 RepID=A0A3N5B9N4_9BACI|nr:nuclease-related domain-containing protein [Aquisalibacillus elongatus]RPF54087.1 nuclease-like protein [Aquisalibacillus elongatus]